MLAALCGEPRLLLIDRAEHHRDEVALLASELLPGAPDLRILVTSRVVLDVAGEVCWAVPPLDCPSVTAGAAEIASCDAVRLFIARVGERLPGFSLADAAPHAVGELCRGLGGLPLAIELIAGWVGTLSIREIVQQRAALLDYGRPGSQGGRRLTDVLGHLAARQGKWKQAAERYEASVRNSRIGGHSHDMLEAMIGLGRTYHRLGLPAEATRHLRTAEALAGDIANQGLLAEVRAALAEVSGGQDGQLPGGLTSRQAKVLRLLADGLSNKQIAERLCLSPGTVERHLATIYRTGSGSVPPRLSRPTGRGRLDTRPVTAVSALLPSRPLAPRTDVPAGARRRWAGGSPASGSTSGRDGRSAASARKTIRPGLWSASRGSTRCRGTTSELTGHTIALMRA